MWVCVYCIQNIGLLLFCWCVRLILKVSCELGLCVIRNQWVVLCLVFLIRLCRVRQLLVCLDSFIFLLLCIIVIIWCSMYFGQFLGIFMFSVCRFVCMCVSELWWFVFSLVIVCLQLCCYLFRWQVMFGRKQVQVLLDLCIMWFLLLLKLVE